MKIDRTFKQFRNFQSICTTALCFLALTASVAPAETNASKKAAASTTTIAMTAPTSHAQQTVNGRVESIEGFRVLRVWGTPQEMGFAHGYLLGEELIKNFTPTGYIPGRNDIKELDRSQQTLLPHIQYPKHTLEEIKGIYDGIVARFGGQSPTLPNLDRSLHLNDLILLNAGDMLRAYGCSGFTVWGDKTGDQGVITTRNFDFYITSPSELDQQLILVRHPNNKKAVASIAWPTYIGAFTGINADGVCAFMHDGTGQRIRKPSGQTIPVSLVLKDILEDANPKTAPAIAREKLSTNTPYPFSYMVRVVTPSLNGAIKKPAHVFRVDGSGLSENPNGDGYCITTNHYLNEQRDPLTSAHEWSSQRYDRIYKSLQSKIDPTSAWETQNRVSVSQKHQGTLHALVALPDQREIHLGFAHWNNHIISATKKPATKISFDQLFKKDR